MTRHEPHFTAAAVIADCRPWGATVSDQQKIESIVTRLTEQQAKTFAVIPAGWNHGAKI
ncbi:hypothetical protein [Actinotalea ferrariae]|uniref:hypothetical protein n=1 Tax=Actinotalea ferrariae TaxID=1386098 RepID=UPI0012DF56F9|nr:hypothetical protein [Actinotalea ferrariae]